MNHYDRIAKVIRYLDSNHGEQPNLDRLAALAGLSSFHFHRLFVEWAGVTPKDFIQCLTLEHAKRLLRRGESVLGSALEAGLSGPGRLHDLCVSLEAASPGEIKAGGLGLCILAGFTSSPFGTCLIAQTERGICHLSFLEESEMAEAWRSLQDDWPKAALRRSDQAAREMARTVFGRGEKVRSARLRALVRGTPFQVKVWQALLQVPVGCLISYGQLAGNVGDRSAARAVGSAVGQNPIAFLIPCHRVIRSTGVIGEYRWGRARKMALLAWENAGRARPDAERLNG